MQRRIQLVLNKLVTIKFYFQVNSILQTNINSLCSLFKIPLLIFGPRKFGSSRIFPVFDVLAKRSEAIFQVSPGHPSPVRLTQEVRLTVARLRRD